MSDPCGCIYVDLDATFEVSSYKVFKARKRHLCSECQAWIDRGEKYERHTGLIEGHWENYKTCLDCVSARDAFFCQGWYFTFIWEEIREHVRWADIDICCLEKLTPVARARVIGMIDEEDDDG